MISHCGLICISLMIRDMEHVFICVLAICWSLLGKCLCSFFAHFIILFFCYWVVWVPALAVAPMSEVWACADQSWSQGLSDSGPMEGKTQQQHRTRGPSCSSVWGPTVRVVKLSQEEYQVHLRPQGWNTVNSSSGLGNGKAPWLLVLKRVVCRSNSVAAFIPNISDICKWSWPSLPDF